MKRKWRFLLGLTLVAVIGYACYAVHVMRQRENSEEEQTAVILAKHLASIMTYRGENSRLDWKDASAWLNEESRVQTEWLLKKRNRTDVWGNEILYSVDGDKLIISSAGKDSISGTEDDVTLCARMSDFDHYDFPAMTIYQGGQVLRSLEAIGPQPPQP